MDTEVGALDALPPLGSLWVTAPVRHSATFLEVADVGRLGATQRALRGPKLVFLALKAQPVRLCRLVHFGAPDQIVRWLLDASPELAQVRTTEGDREPWEKVGELPLHVALRARRRFEIQSPNKVSAASEVVLLVLHAYPDAAFEEDGDGVLPLVNAISANPKIAEELLRVNPRSPLHQSRNQLCPFFGAFFHNASEEVMEAMLQACPEAAYAAFPGPVHGEAGGLALHLAMKGIVSAGVVDALLRVHPEAARNLNANGETPLHLAIRRELPPRRVEALLQACPAAAMTKTVEGDLPLHLAVVEPQAPQRVIDLLLYTSPEAVLERNASGNTPLHLALAQITVMEDLGLFDFADSEPDNTSVETVLALLKACPEAAKLPDPHGNFPLHLAVRVSAPPEVLRALLHVHPEAANASDADGYTPQAQTKAIMDELQSS